MYQAAACIDRSGLYYSDSIQEKQKDAPEAANGLRDVLLLCKRARTLIERGERRPVLPAVKLGGILFSAKAAVPSAEAAVSSAAFDRNGRPFSGLQQAYAPFPLV